MVLGGIAAHAYAQPRYGYAECFYVTKRVFDPYYGWVVRQVRVCN